jgi:cytochrome b561
VDQWRRSTHVFALICFGLAVVAAVYGLFESGRDRSESMVWAAFMAGLGVVFLVLWRVAVRWQRSRPADRDR